MATLRESSNGDWPTTRVTLLRRIANQGDSTSWELFERTYTPLIHIYCRRRGMQEADACDVVQEVLLQISRGIASFRYDAQRGMFRNWLGTVVHRAMLKNLEKRSRSRQGAGDLSAESSLACRRPLDGDWVEAFNAHVYRVATERLQLAFCRDTWHAFQKTFAEDCPPEEVAAEMNRSIGWVYQAKSKVVRGLRDEILDLAEDSVLFNLDATGKAHSH